MNYSRHMGGSQSTERWGGGAQFRAEEHGEQKEGQWQEGESIKS